ncbi:MAG: IclR family transcriptional regulator [Lentisphaerae bacterium]|jgi:DNA-binding IclR family transcriptional regulator|nr:IclR family transcriptional regulator [Lentisphaerota bacterium]MBT4817633.1 IclR family transcriptional regulator [Lentisphaerota bacterium]MBT5605377.1 IclR family transcriptional regulator [Lentisphaerota bacterium]MBT7060382.1 IclR family transcriptional regulator [Lentisphaerota bacterium]MBT7844764.1 IclR family transcriptional regulator [Lentisphaerota bacterium]
MTDRDTELSADTRYRIPNLERALAILEHLVQRPEGLGVSELTEQLGFPKNSVFRVTMTLLHHGYLQRDGQKRFSVSSKLLGMGCSTLSDEPLVPAALEVMQQCRDAVRETVLIGTMVQNEGVVMEQVLGTHPFKFSVDLGMRIPAHTAAPTKAMLAYLPPDEREQVIRSLSYDQFNENTILSSDHFRRELAKVRQAGYAVDRGELLRGVHCVGAPVFGRYGTPVAAIWTTGPEDRIPAHAFPNVGRTIRQHADRVSAKLGWTG